MLGKGEGDYCIYQIAPPDGDLPKGSLLPIPNVPRFENGISALKWIRNDSGDMLAGKQLMVLKALEILNVVLKTTPQVVIESKQKTIITDPTKEQVPF